MAKVERIAGEIFRSQLLEEEAEPELSSGPDQSITNESENGPTFVEYTESDWNSMLSPPPKHMQVTTATETNNPTVSPADRISSTRPKHVKYSSEIFQKAVGFRNINKVLAKMNLVSQNTLQVHDLGKDPVRDPG
eukprot:13298036-Ditylum_brightwellii.AAC.1